MAQMIQLVDDVDGGPADETIRFTLDGKPRTIDLNSENAAKLRATVAPWFDASRPDAEQSQRRGRSASSSSGGRTTDAERARNNAIREWGRETGHKVNERGRVPAGVLAAHEAAGYPATSGRPDGEPSAQYAATPDTQPETAPAGG